MSNFYDFYKSGDFKIRINFSDYTSLTKFYSDLGQNLRGL